MTHNQKHNTRAIAALLCQQIIDQGKSLDKVLANYFDTNALSPSDQGFCQQMVYGVCRYYGELHHISQALLNRPIRKKDRLILFIILIGLYQLRKLNTPEHAAISETVNATQYVKKSWAKGLVNACLRQHQRQPIVDTSIQLNYQDWLVEQIQQDWPDHAKTILHANLEKAPMCLRINKRKTTRQDYLACLDDNDIGAKKDPYSDVGILLDQAVNVEYLPNFHSGFVSIQDSAAQLATSMLDLKNGHTVLDACAAPGGKTAHILERYDVDMTAIDISTARCQQLSATLERLNLKANIIQTDARLIEQFDTPNDGYDRILLDAPCSSLGVIRRHPDILHHRNPQDIQNLSLIQAELLDALWKRLKPGGKLLYLTCSILNQENEQQIERFTQNNPYCQNIRLKHPNALSLNYGAQTLPGVHSMDGFYYALLQKTKR